MSAGEKERAEEAVRALKGEKRPEGYRERSLRIHGNVCARCMREFTGKNLKLLTVHHKDGDHDNNPPDGSNWENLCIYCHEEEHSRELLGDYEGGSSKAREEERKVVHSSGNDESDAMGAFGSLLKAAMKK
ncbi:MAG: HNH endonuclease [Deltaproteobacteria bacterium]|nr:MAG: HNH endonuclease [Deltaproteobacteria bacterium]